MEPFAFQGSEPANELATISFYKILTSASIVTALGTQGSTAFCIVAIREFNRLYKELDDLYHNLALRQGLSDSASIILYALYLLGDGCLQRDICDLSYISKQTINSSIRRLEQDGYLYLQPGRGRDMHICLTPEGRRLVEEKAAPVAAMEERAFSGMPQEDQQALLRLTHAYLARLRAEAGRIL